MDPIKSGTLRKGGTLRLERRSDQRGRVELHHGRWTVLYWVRDSSKESGWRRRRECLNAECENEAILDAARVLAIVNQLNQLSRRETRRPTLKEFVIDQWAGYLAYRKYAPSAIARYDAILERRVLPLIGNMQLHHIAPSDICNVIDSARREKQPELDHNLYELLEGLFELAVEYDEINVSPVRPRIHRPPAA